MGQRLQGWDGNLDRPVGDARMARTVYRVALFAKRPINDYAVCLQQTIQQMALPQRHKKTVAAAGLALLQSSIQLHPKHHYQSGAWVYARCKRHTLSAFEAPQKSEFWQLGQASLPSHPAWPADFWTSNSRKRWFILFTSFAATRVHPTTSAASLV